MEAGWRLGFQTQREELRNVDLDATEPFPEWLDGTLVCNGPGEFEVGDTALAHWFDPLAMLRGFRFDDGGVRYANRFVRSEDFRVARDRGRVRRSLPGTPADDGALVRAYRTLTGAFQDNPSIGVTRLDGSLYAVTESPVGIEIDPETLETIGRRDLTAGLDADVTLGHTHVEDGTQWGLAADFGRRSAYTLFRRDAGESPTPVSRLVFDSHPPYVAGSRGGSPGGRRSSTRSPPATPSRRFTSSTGPPASASPPSRRTRFSYTTSRTRTRTATSSSWTRWRSPTRPRSPA